MLARIGFIGGTFDPVHYGHLCPAVQAARQLKLDELQFIPCAEPRHRQPAQRSFDERLQLLTLALATSDWPDQCHPADLKLSANAIEQQQWQQGIPSYTVETLTALRRQWPAATFFWLLGADAFAHLTHWYQWQKLFDLCHVIVCQRSGYSLSVPTELLPYRSDDLSCWQRDGQDDWQGRWQEVQVSPRSESSTVIRQRIAKGSSIQGMLPETVREQILLRQFYSSS